LSDVHQASESEKSDSNLGGEFDAVVVGAGFSGLYRLHSLRDVVGLNVRVYEAREGVGGTWYWNRYPGARCDSESFSYSFSEELEQEWEWTIKYPVKPEILSYIEHVADRFDLRRDIQFGTRVAEAFFSESSDRWEISTDGGDRVTAQFFISAVDCLSAANVPEFKGLDRFKGEWVHAGAWPHDGVDFTGKCVVLIGTGSAGIQATPVIAEEADHLTVFQRTANFSTPARNGPLDLPAKYRFIENVRILSKRAGGDERFASWEAGLLNFTRSVAMGSVSTALRRRRPIHVTP